MFHGKIIALVKSSKIWLLKTLYCLPSYQLPQVVVFISKHKLISIQLNCPYMVTLSSIAFQMSVAWNSRLEHISQDEMFLFDLNMLMLFISLWTNFLQIPHSCIKLILFVNKHFSKLSSKKKLSHLTGKFLPSLWIISCTTIITMWPNFQLRLLH